MRYGYVLALFICGLAGVLMSCTSNAANFHESCITPASTTGTHSDDTSHSSSVERAIGEARAYVPPATVTDSADYDPLVFEMLRSEFIRQVELSADRDASFVPIDESGKVTNLTYDSIEGTLSWSYKNIGDYDSSGEVGIPDITMIAQNYLANTTDGIGNDALENWIDGDQSGEVGISDITQIAQGYLNTVTAYRILTSKYYDEGFVAIGDDIQIGDDYEFPVKLSTPMPDGAKMFVTVAPVDEFGNVGENSNPVIFAYSLFSNVSADSIFLYSPTKNMRTGEWAYVFVCANVSVSKPLSGVTARILVDQNSLNATDMGCMATSNTNDDFQNMFANGMAVDGLSGGDVFYPGFATCDFWKGFADQEGVTLISSPALPSPGFVDVGIYWDYRNNFIERKGIGILAVIKFRAFSAGTASLLIQGRDSEDNVKTVYTDLAKNTHEFADTGEAITISIS